MCPTYFSWRVVLTWLAMIALFCLFLTPTIAVIAACFIAAKIEDWRSRNKPAEFEGWMV